MKSIMNKIIVLAFILLLIPGVAIASSSTSYTWTLNSKGMLVRTQDAYLPDQTLVELGISNPEDIYIDREDYLYIADTGNKRIIKLDTNTLEVVLEITNEEFSKPTGVFVTDDFEIYVADPGSKKVYKFNQSGELLDTFGRPTAVSYGNSDFAPTKVAVDKGQNMFIISEGVYNGIIQLSSSGEFLGFFATNQITLNLVQKLQDMFFTEEQKTQLFDRVPSTFSNVFVDPAGVVYSTTMGNQVDERIKKHNIAGGNMISRSLVLDDFIDIYVDQNGIMYVASLEGYIAIYSADGDFIYLFGSSNNKEDVAGLYTELTSLAVDSKGNIWTVDGEKSFVQTFNPTSYAKTTYAALESYNNGLYAKAQEEWSEVLRLNQMSVLAHYGLGKAYLFQQNYTKAMDHFEIAGSRGFYSEAYWEVRNIWLQNNIEYVFFALIGLLLLIPLIRVLDQKKRIKNTITKIKVKIASIRILSDLGLIFKVMRHPLDTMYYIRKNKVGSILSATIILFTLFTLFIISNIGNDFIYQFIPIEDIDLNSLVIGFFIIIGVFIICNYLVSSIDDGEGNIATIYKAMMYTTGPILIAFVLKTALSYVLTFNEAFILGLIMQIGYVWTSINVLLAVQEIHNYTTRKAIKSIILTFIFMIIIAVFTIIVLMMSDQLIQFAQAIFSELKNLVGEVF